MPYRSWRHARGTLELDRCLVMAIVNVTPDSFSDGGRWASADGATRIDAIVGECRAWVELGASILDVGGESTRPGAEAVDEALERARVIPVIEALHADQALAHTPISVDTRHASVARAALAVGASIVNDVSGLQDPELAKVVADAGAGLVISHLRGDLATMQQRIEFTRLIAEVGDELAARVSVAEAAGVSLDQIVVDPGIGFGKTAGQSAALVGSSEVLSRRTGRPVLIGASRKRFLGPWTGRSSLAAHERMLGSVTAAVVAAGHGAAIVRVHDVAETLEALRVHAGLEAALAAELAHDSRSATPTEPRP